MKLLTSFRAIQASALVVMAILSVIRPVQPVHAGGGIVLRPPFDGTYRITAYFDHDDPNYTEDGYNWIYNGERVPATGYPSCTGEPYPYDGHDGWDWSMYKEDVLAAADGVVEFVGWYYGLTIVIDHSNNYHTYYSHLNAVQPGVSVGTPVEAGQLIGESGDSGAEGSWHLHFGVRHGADWDSGDYSIDPFGWRGSGRDPLFDFNGEESSCLWAGVPGEDISCADIIVEDDGAGWEQYPSLDKNCWESGSWQRCDKGNGFRYHWTDVWSPADFWVAWRPWYSCYGQLRYPGYYQVHAFVPAAGDSSKTKTGNARYEVHHGYYYNQTTIVPVNQASYSNRWVPLGSYWLWPGQMGGYVSMYDYTGETSGSRKIVADALKFSASIVYLPEVKNTGGWTSSIVIRNNGASSAQVGINYYNTSGGRVSDQTMTIAGNGSKTKAPPSGFSGSAVVVASQDVSVVVENRCSSNGRTYAYNGISADGPGNPAFERAGPTLYAPSIYINIWGWNSTVEAMNTGSATANVQFQFKGRSGYGDIPYQSNIPPNGRTTIALGGGPWVGSLVIESTNGQPLAAVVHEHHTGQAARAYNVSAAGSTPLYVPAAYKNQWGMTSGLTVQNVGSASTTAYLYFYDRDGRYRTSHTLSNIGAKRAAGVWLGNVSGLGTSWTGWVKVVSYGQPLAIAVTTVRPEGYYDYTGASTAGNAGILPWAAKNAGGRTTGYTVLNTSGSQVQVTATYYGGGGNVSHSETYSLSPGEVVGRHQSNDPLPNGWQGSIVLQANEPLVVVMREDGGSTTSAYNGVAR